MDRVSPKKQRDKRTMKVFCFFDTFANCLPSSIVFHTYYSTVLPFNIIIIYRPAEHECMSPTDELRAVFINAPQRSML